MLFCDLYYFQNEQNSNRFILLLIVEKLSPDFSIQSCHEDQPEVYVIRPCSLTLITVVLLQFNGIHRLPLLIFCEQQFISQKLFHGIHGQFGGSFSPPDWNRLG